LRERLFSTVELKDNIVGSSAMTRFKELARIQAAIKHKDESELRWADWYCRMRQQVATRKYHTQYCDRCKVKLLMFSSKLSQARTAKMQPRVNGNTGISSYLLKHRPFASLTSGTRPGCALVAAKSHVSAKDHARKSPRRVVVKKSRYRSFSLAMLWLGFRAMRLTLPIFSFQPTRFGHVVEDFAVAASSLRSEDSEHVLQVV